jgi:hypothetical protein
MRWAIALLLLCGLSGGRTIPPTTHAALNETEVASFESSPGPLIYWTAGVSTLEDVRQAGVVELAVPAPEAAQWQKAGFKVRGIAESELAKLRKVAVPKLAGRGNVASATRRPWIDANGWVFTKYPTGKFIYDELPTGKAGLAAAEAYAYGVEALLKIGREDLTTAARTIGDLRRLPVEQLPIVADFTVVDNDSPQIDEVLNLLTRRNLLYRIVPAPVASYPINIRLGSQEYPEAAAADPSAFAQSIRLKIGDENRSLRVYGSEIIIARLTGDGRRGRVHLLNYSGRQAEGLRVRIRGNYRSGSLAALGVEGQSLEDPLIEKGLFEGTIPKMGNYAVIDLR